MSEFESLALVKYPRDIVFETSRDALPRAARHVDDIERIVCEGRRELPDGTVVITNTWFGKTPLPEILQGIVSQHMLVWTDESVWSGDEHVCRWNVVSRYFPEYVRCSGATRFEATTGMRATRVALHGSITVDPRGVPLPQSVAPQVALSVEQFVCALFPWGLRKVMDGVSRTIEEIAREKQAI